MSVSISSARRCLSRFLLLSLSVLAVHAATELPVETKPPAIYRKQLEASLTPLDAILKLPVTAAAAGDSGIILLDERLVAVDEQGRRTIVWHFAYKTLTDAGIKSNGEDVSHFDKHDQKAYLVLAETIQPDGTRQRVQPNAVLVQTPQRQAQYSLYDDQAELKIIFPDVRVGSITHGIVIVEDLVTTIPGEVCHNFSWGSTWAVARLRYEINLPKALDARLKIESLGAGVPAAKTTAVGTGRVRHAWALDDVHGERYERGRPPASQAGPALQLSTLASWDAIGAWYRGLLQGRGELKPELARQVDEWCKDAATPADVLATLHARVADDIRYVGLEFGAAAYQPHDCNEVWSLRYGDCKDKANLLVAMLRHRGIPAGIALVSTEHLGLVNRRLPTYQAFNHAIVAIPQPGGGHLFCDPTIAYSTPGMLGTRSSDRDVFFVSSTGADWVHTPPATAGTLHYSFDLKLTESGELSGWLTLTTDGSYGAFERRRYTRLEPQDVRSNLSELIREFYPGAEVIDTSLVPGNRADPYIIKAYFRVPGAAQPSDHKPTLAFPDSSGLLPNLGDSAERQSTYFLDRDLIKLDATIALPPGFQAGKIPPEFRLDTGGAVLRASWSAGDGSCRAELELQMKDAAIRRDEFARLYQARQSLLAWLGRPLLLETGAATSRAAPTGEIDFPLMPTGDGQIALADSRYPYTGDVAARRVALERTIQYFPKDPNTVFRVGVRLAVLDWDANRNEAAHERLASLLSAYAGQVSAENYGWGQNVDGLVLRDLGRDAEALVLLEAVTRDEQLGMSRRTTAAPEAAALLAKSNAPAAIVLLEKISALPDGSTPAIESRLARLYLESGRASDLAARLRKIAQSRPDSAEEQFAGLLESAANWPAPADGESPAAQLASIIAALIPQPGENLNKLLAEARSAATLRKVHAAFTAAVAQPPLAAWNTKAAPLSLADYDKTIAEADKKSDGAAGFRAALQAVIHFPADSGFPQRLWRAANYADWTERQETVSIPPAVADGLLDLCDGLPSGSEYYVEGKLLRAGRLHRAANYEAEATLLQDALKLRNLAEGSFLALTRRLAACRESQGNYEEALRLYATVEALAATYRTAAEAVLRAVFIELHLGRDADALHGIDILRRAPAAVTKNMAGRDQAAELVALAASGQAEAVWRNGRAWWPQWRKLAAPHVGAADTPGAIVPVITALTDLGGELGAAKRDKNNPAFFRSLDIIMGGARWLPSYGFEVATLFNLFVSTTPLGAESFRQIIVALLESPHPAEIGNAAGARVQLAAHYIDGNQPAKAVPVARDFVQHPPAGAAAMVPSMVRLWGLSALSSKTDTAAAAAALANALKDPKLAEQRSTTVLILADLYHQLGKPDEEQALLKRELANPVIVADTAGAATVQTRLERLASEKEFGLEVARWRETAGIGWYDAAEPASLDDPRLRNLNAVLEAPDKYFNAAEKVKLLLLAAQAEQVPIAQRQAALRAAANAVLQNVPTWSRFEQVAASVVDNPAFDLETRVSTLWLTLIYSGSSHREDVYGRWRKHALTERFGDAYKKNMVFLDQWIAHDPYSVASMLELADTFAADELSAFQGFMLTDIFQALLSSGDFEAAEKLLRLMPSLRTAADFNPTIQARQLEYARLIRLARLNARIHDVLTTLVTRRYPGLADQLPAAYADLRYSAVVPNCSPADTLQACLYLLKSRRYYRGDFDFWSVLARNLPRTPEGDAFGCELITAAFGAAETDDLKATVFTEFIGALDLDSPVIAATARQLSATVTDPKLYPDTYLRAKLLDYQLASRAGKVTEVDSYFAGLPGPAAPFIRQAAALNLYTRTRDVPALTRVVDGMNADLLLNSSSLVDTIPALTLLDRKDELAAAREVARRELRKEVAQSWLDHSSTSVATVGRFADLLHEPDLVPVAWAAELSRSLSDPFRRMEVQVISAAVRDDWTTLSRVAADLNRDYPTHYYFYWWRGLAESKLGHPEAARAALEVYTRYAKDEPHYLEAVALLQQLGAKP